MTRVRGPGALRKSYAPSAVTAEARRQGCRTVVDGTHADDHVATRSEMRALCELGVPVRPPSACLATRIPAGAVKELGCMDVAIASGGCREGGVDSWKR